MSLCSVTLEKNAKYVVFGFCFFLNFKVYIWGWGIYAFFPQVLSELDIMVPLQLLISMFSDGVNSVKELASQRKSRVNELAGNLAARRVIIATTIFVLLRFCQLYWA